MCKIVKMKRISLGCEKIKENHILGVQMEPYSDVRWSAGLTIWEWDSLWTSYQSHSACVQFLPQQNDKSLHHELTESSK